MENNNTDELEKLRIENALLKEKLKKYTAPARSKTYYENHKEEILIKKKRALIRMTLCRRSEERK